MKEEEKSGSGIYAVIMAGGHGERFWPQSRLSHPKQLLHLLGNLTLIEQTVERIHSVFPYERIMIITTSDYVAPMRTMLTNIPQENIVNEPEGKNTAPCIAFAIARIREQCRDRDPVLALFPADHVINDKEAFAAEAADCMRFAAGNDQIVTLGIPPSFPSTGYGYIRLGESLPWSGSSVFRRSAGFTEKPPLSCAEQFLADGHYVWNSGIFFARVSVMLDAFRSCAPDLYRFCMSLSGKSREKTAELYKEIRSVSIDYCVMEKAENIVVADASFDWDDIGSWNSMRNQILPGENNNVVHGLHVGLDTKDCVIIGGSRHLIATVDIKDTIIIHTDDATLVCSGKSAQRVKDLVQRIREKPDLKSFL